MRTNATEHIPEMGHTNEQEILITLHILESASQTALSQDTAESDLVKTQSHHILLKKDQRKLYHNRI